MLFVPLPQSLNGEEYSLRVTPELEPERDAPDLREKLEDAGLSVEQVASVLAAVETEADHLAFHRAGEVLRQILSRVAKRSTFGAALAHAVGLHDNSLAELASELGYSKQAVGNILARIAPLLGELSTSKARHAPTPIKRPEMPGEWLTIVEAVRFSKRTVQEIQDAAIAGELRREFVGRRAFYEEADLEAWTAGRMLTEATRDKRNLQPCPTNTQTCPDSLVSPISQTRSE